jgi:hypothetical protein
MSNPFHTLAVSSQLVAIVMAAAGSAGAQSAPVVFQGFAHAPIGIATLHVDPARAALDVRGLRSTGEDGFAVKRDGATSWTARIEVPLGGAPPVNLVWSALADGRPIGTGLLRQNGDMFEMSGVFTGGTTTRTFSAHVYNNGRLVGAVGSQPPAASAFVPIDICRVFTDLCRVVAEFHTLPDGACMVRIAGARAVPIRLPNGTVVTGNELRLVEEVSPAGHYPYLGFDTMVIRSDAPSIAILSETLR